MRQGFRLGGFSYAIDYDKEIAEDLRALARLEQEAALWPLLTPEEQDFARESGSLPTGYLLAMSDPARCTAMGFPPEAADEVAALLDARPMDYDKLADGWYRRAELAVKAAVERYGEQVGIVTPAMRTKAKAALARHRRNKAKNT